MNKSAAESRGGKGDGREKNGQELSVRRAGQGNVVPTVDRRGWWSAERGGRRGQGGEERRGRGGGEGGEGRGGRIKRLRLGP